MNTLKCCRSRIIELSSVAQLTVALSVVLIIACIVLPVTANAVQGERLVVLPFEMVDNTPVPGGDERNQEMLDKITRFIAQRIEQEGLFEVIPQNQVNEAVSAAQLGTYIHTCNRCEYDLAKQVGGDKVMIGWIYKMSMLILTMHIEIKTVASEKTLISKAYDFRGDNEKAWRRAAQYMVRDMAEKFQAQSLLTRPLN
jgi:hypothetical protein